MKEEVEKKGAECLRWEVPIPRTGAAASVLLVKKEKARARRGGTKIMRDPGLVAS